MRSPADAREERDTLASDWAARLATGPLTADCAEEMLRWLATDARHRGALIRAQAALAALSGPQSAETSVKHGIIGRRAVLGGGAACALAGAFLALRPDPVLATGIGEIRQTPLTDGSSVVLDTATRLQPDFSRHIRRLRLEQGRALFRVAHDPARPFIVEAGNICVRALGTVFSVEQTGAVDVLVTEGVVEVTGARRPILLRAGQRGRFRAGAAADAERLTAQDLAHALDWREGRLELYGQTLASAVATINRYNRRAIIVRDPALAREPLHGAFRNDDPEGFARIAALSLDAHARIEPDRIVIDR